MKYSLLFLLFFFLGGYMFAQIVNIEERRLENEEGFKGNIDLNFSFTKNIAEVLELENLNQFSFRKKKNLFLFINEFEVIRKGHDDVLNNGFLHFRYNYRISKLLVMEAFAQYQFNQVQRIDKRVLLGLGPRFEIIRKDSVSLNLGSQLMREFEKTTKGEYQDNFRMSNYLSLAWQINAPVNFSSTTYYQPKVNELDDYRISNKSVLAISVSKKLAVKIIYELLNDSKVPEGVPSTVYSLETGISFAFY